MKFPGFFKKNKDNRKINDDKSVAVPTYGPHDHLVPEMYYLTTGLSVFEAGFERTCRDFLKKTTTDKFNRGYIDALIDKTIEEALESLQIQEIGHHETIDGLTETRAADLVKGRAKLQGINEEILEVEQEKAQLERIYHAGTSLETPETTDITPVPKKEVKNNEASAA